MLVDSTLKEFEKPETGVYDAVLADVVNLGNVTVVYKGVTKVQPKVRLVWILNTLDSTGQNFRVMQQVTASMFDKAKLFDIVKSIIGTIPTCPFDLETLIGKNVQLVVSKEQAPNTKWYANVKAILPAKASFVVPPSFVRDHIKKALAAAAQGAPVAAAPATQATTHSQTAVPAAAPAAAVAAVVSDEEIPF